MTTNRWFSSLVLGGAATCALAFAAVALSGAPGEGDGPVPTLDQLQKLSEDGNYAEAYDGCRRAALDPKAPPRQVGQILDLGTRSLQRLNREDEDRRVSRGGHPGPQGELATALGGRAQLHEWTHHGFMIAGEFWRGQHRGGGKVVNAAERDRVRALQLMSQALPLAVKDENHAEVGNFLLALGHSC